MDSPSPYGANNDAIALLTEDHSKVKQLFREFDDIKNQPGQADLKAELVEQICFELTVHAEIEEEIFYPAARAEIDADDLIDEAETEHVCAKELISLLEGMEPGDAEIDATVAELRRQVEHHITEEENNIFPRTREAGMDLDALCTELSERKEELESELAGAPPAGLDASGDSPSAGQPRS